MSSSVDDRIVAMKFDNTLFERGATKALAILDKLKASLDFSTASKGLDTLKTSAGRFNLSSLMDATAGAQAGFLALATVGITALSRLTNAGIDAGLSLVKSLTIGPIAEGYADYGRKLTSIQTITNATGASIETVQAYFNELDEYADKTIYNLSDMTGAFAKFTNAGVDMDKSIPAIKGIANMVALAGQDAGAASIAMYNLSQSISGGFLTTTDYKSLNLANVATKEWKDNMIKAAVAAGDLKKVGEDSYAILSDGSGKVVKSAAIFNEELSRGIFTTDTLLKVLGDYGNTNTVIGKKAQAAAQDVKSFGMMMDTLKAAVGTSWTDSFQLIIGDLEESKVLFTDLTNYIGGFLSAMGDARNKTLADFKALGGREHLIQAFKNAFQAILSVIKPIHDAFREIFPAATGKDLLKITIAIEKFFKGLILGKEASDGLRRTFAGLFAAIDIVFTILRGVARYFLTLFGLIGSKGTPGVLEFTGSIGDLIVALDEWLSSGDKIKKFFDKIIATRAAIFGPILSAIGSLFALMGKLVKTGAVAFFEGLGKAAQVIGPVLQRASDAIGSFIDSIDFSNVDLGSIDFGAFFASIGSAFSKAFSSGSGGLSSLFSGLGAGISAALSGLDAIFDGIGQAAKGAAEGVGAASDALGDFASGTGSKAKDAGSGLIDIFQGIGRVIAAVGRGIRAVWEFIGRHISFDFRNLSFDDVLSAIKVGLFGGFYLIAKRFFETFGTSIAQVARSASGALDQVSSNLKTMQTDIRANIILKIAAAVAILAAALYVLSKIPAKELGIALGAVTAMMAELVGALLLLQAKTLKAGGGVGTAASLTLMSVAMIGIATAITILAGAVAIFGNMDLKTLEKGVGTVVVIVTAFSAMAIALAKTGGGVSMVAAAVAIGILSVALTALAGTLKLYASIDWSTIISGGIKVALVLVAIGLAMRAFPKGMIATAAGILAVTASLYVIAKVLKMIGDMSLWDIIKAVGALAIVLGLMTSAMLAAEAGLPGAAAMVVMAGAIYVLAKALKVIGDMSLWDIIKALGALFVVFTAFTVLSVLLIEAVPFMLAMGIALGVFGLALLAAGAGIFLFATALQLLVAVGVAGLKSLAVFIVEFGKLIPLIFEQIEKAVVAGLQVIAHTAPELGKTMVAILTALLQTVIDTAPKMGEAFTVLIRTAIKTVVDLYPDIIQAGYDLLISFLKGIRDNIKEIVNVGVDIITGYVDAIGSPDNVRQIVDSGFILIINFIRGITDGINEHAGELRDAGGDMAFAIADGLSFGLASKGKDIFTGGFNLAKKGIEGIAKGAGVESPSKEAFKIAEFIGDGLVLGSESKESNAFAAGHSLGSRTVEGIKSAVTRMTDLISGDLDVNPVIAPVLDLEKFRKDASFMGALLDTNPIAATTSFDQATAIATEKQQATDEGTDEPGGKGDTTLEFNQYNTSPKALSEVEIYRGGKSMISLAKKVLEEAS